MVIFASNESGLHWPCDKATIGQFKKDMAICPQVCGKNAQALNDQML
jgi:hypothetical protein